MKKEITFTSIPLVDPETYRALLDDFEAKTNIHVNLELVEWEQYRSHFVNIALQHRHGDVATAGTPITSDLIVMNALRPFSAIEISMLGGALSFLPSRWQSGIRPGDMQVWAIPWMLDLRVFYYWRDLLAEAGVDETVAFASPKGFAEALRKLAEHGQVIPWTGPNERYATLHTAASWLWAHGMDLFSPDGGKVIFHENEALEGLREYFQAVRIAGGTTGPTNNNRLFSDRQAAVMLGNAYAGGQETPPELGCAPVLGQSYVGGADLMIWEHTHNASAALELVRFLSGSDIQARLAASASYLPTRMTPLTEMAGHSQRVHQTLAQAALSGRTFPCVPMVGLVEDRLSLMLYHLQQEMLNSPETDFDSLLNKRLVQLGNRTNLSLIR